MTLIMESSKSEALIKKDFDEAFKKVDVILTQLLDHAFKIGEKR